MELAAAFGAGGARVLEPAMAVTVNAATATMEESSPEPLAFVSAGELDLVGPGVSGAARWRGMVEELREGSGSRGMVFVCQFVWSGGELKKPGGGDERGV